MVLLSSTFIFVVSKGVRSWVPREWSISHQLSMSDWTTPPVPGAITLGIGFSVTCLDFLGAAIGISSDICPRHLANISDRFPTSLCFSDAVLGF